MLVTFLFWNINKRPLQDRVARIAALHSVDVIVLAECDAAPETILASLNGGAARPYVFPHNAGEKLRVFTRFDEALLTSFFDDTIGGLTIRRLRVGPPPGILLAAAHLPSRVNWSKDDQTLAVTTLAQDIGRAETFLANDRTVLVGDFNMNPYDAGVTGAHGLHAVMTKEVAAKLQRTVQGRAYRFFYNPMWGHFGDRTSGPAGTYYLRSSHPSNPFWHIYDQVLLRPSLMHHLRLLSVLDSDGQSSLLTPSGAPKRATGSDHLPVLFQLDL